MGGIYYNLTAVQSRLSKDHTNGILINWNLLYNKVHQKHSHRTIYWAYKVILRANVKLKSWHDSCNMASIYV